MSTNDNNATIAQPASSISTDGVQSISTQTTGFTLTTPCYASKILQNHWRFILACWV